VRSLLVLICLVACGSQTRSSTQQPETAKAREPVRDAVIEGDVVDSETHEKLGGATVIAKPAADGEEAVVISDEAGHFRIAVASGVHHVTTYYADVETTSGDVRASAHAVTRLEIAVDHAAIEAAEAQPEYPECPAAAGPPASTVDLEAVVTSALARYLDPDEYFPDTPRGLVYIVAEIDDTMRLRVSMLPGTTQKRVLISRRDLQAEADRTGSTIRYVSISRPKIAGDCAEVSVGTSLMIPTRSNITPLCCCSTHDLFEKRNGAWVFKAHVMDACA
jgi:hypothetical protein